MAGEVAVDSEAMARTERVERSLDGTSEGKHKARCARWGSSRCH